MGYTLGLWATILCLALLWEVYVGLSTVARDLPSNLVSMATWSFVMRLLGDRLSWTSLSTWGQALGSGKVCNGFFLKSCLGIPHSTVVWKNLHAATSLVLNPALAFIRGAM